MASSSASPFRPLKYDVFLSFRGKNTRNTYLGHLYTALTKRGIYTYKDDKTLPRGDTINPSLLKAIKESQIAIVVFSENYADSSWCLRELDCIMELWRKEELIVMPIFYNVTTSDVKDEDGKFAKDILTIDSKYSEYLDSWRKALVDATSIAGWETANGNEADGIKEIVGEVSKRLKPLDLNAQENLIGIEPRMDELISMLKIGSGGVRMVGIWGIGGGGKTTLASSVYKKISSEFQASCFVENISKRANKLKKLQKKILSDILEDKIKVGSVEEGKGIMESRLRNRERVLIVLDNVDNRAQLEVLAGSHSWFGPETRIIITSRNKQLLNDVDMIYNIKFLTDDEAIWLFRRHALRKRVHIEDDDEIVKLSEEVVFYARGLPLALKVLGLALCNNDMSEWRDTLDRLQKIPEDGILEVLKISYDGLNIDGKELFLDIACFFRHWPKDEAMVILEACALHPVIGIKELELKALITTVNGWLDMHDLIQDMGHHIVQGNHADNPEKLSRIWQDVHIHNMCSWDEYETLENRETRALHAPDYEAPSKLLKVVSNMKNLRSLYVCQEVTETVQEPLFMSNRLRWISWKRYPASLLPRNFQPTNLVGLVLQNSLLQELWRDSKKLPVLKVLDLSNSKNLTTTPDLGGLPNLERLVLSGCTNLTHMHPSLGRHEGLVYLNLDGCDKLAMFPAIVRMQSLDTLILSGCSHLRMFPDIQKHMVSLKHLNLDHSGIEALPSSIGKYCTNLVSISVIGCDHLMKFEYNFQLLNQRWSISVGHVN
ncbi:toll/interleukin-1 receptor (TIR) domain-containing protein [Artemisia annua]|uniref:Toll/interleukin-1 receptor (TIR) domain-containing protein n=1 Tax=Artemisia annua TaxID=35608 RepID=A0A2U1LYT2_ARTAN|nr:toll/interleukin-1 receptor (TIR) domain-containing protein [Artemisia annua]